MKKNEENWKEDTLVHIGAKVPGEFAETFKKYCTDKKFNQRKLFFYLAKWWYEQGEFNQWRICQGRVQEALSQIAEAASSRASAEDENVAASASAKSKRKQSRRRTSKTG
jgi:hypothetical protein